MRERVSVRALAKRVQDRLPRWIQLAPELPELVHEYLRRETAPAPPPPPDPPPRGDRRVALAIAGAGLVIAGAVLLGRPVEGYGLYPGLGVGGLGTICLLFACAGR